MTNKGWTLSHGHTHAMGYQMTKQSPSNIPDSSLTVFSNALSKMFIREELFVKVKLVTIGCLVKGR